MMQLIIRAIDNHDAAIVASVHAVSWRSAYRGILRDEFLDADLLADRMACWERRLCSMPREHFGYVALEAGRPIGFVFACKAHDERWGTLIDNLHVLPSFKGCGAGTQLLIQLCEQLDAAQPQAGLHLWVYEKNAAARAFYQRLGCAAVERAIKQAPGGGEVVAWCYAWPSAKSMLSSLLRGRR